MNYVRDLIRQPSTWRGIITLLTAFGIILSPEQIESVIAGGLAFSGLIGAFIHDDWSGGKK
jgi:hypothetical protein